MSTTPVSLLTLTRDRTPHLVNLLRGVRHGACRPDEVVVVVMGGEDPSPHVPDPGCPLRFAYLEAGGLPLGRARNRAAREALGPGLIFLDVDCIPGRSLVRSYAQALEATDGLLVGGVRYLPPGAPGDALDDEALFESGERHPARPEPPEEGIELTDRYELFWSLSYAVRRETFLDVIGGFDETFAGYGGEDTDLAFRAREAGVPMALVADAWAFHQHHATHEPPLPHIASIVVNARRFREKWGAWPMEGWLEGFAEMGLVRWDPQGDELELVREPTPSELEETRRDSAVPSG